MKLTTVGSDSLTLCALAVHAVIGMLALAFHIIPMITVIVLYAWEFTAGRECTRLLQGLFGGAGLWPPFSS